MATESQRRVFRRLVKQARTDAGLSQRQLATALGIGFTAVSEWERGESPPEDTAARLEHVLHLEEGTLGRMLGFIPYGVQLNAGSSRHRSPRSRPPARTPRTRPASPNTVQLGARMVARGGPVGWGQLAWRARLTCQRGILRLMRWGLERGRRVGLRRRHSSVMARRQPRSVA